MADTKQLQATCPICGYTDTATDGEALEQAIEEHMRLTHNQVMPITKANSDLKQTGREVDQDPDLPALEPSDSLIVPGNTIPTKQPL